MSNTREKTLRLVCISGDFQAAINRAEIPVKITISEEMADQILVMAEALDSTEGTELQMPVRATMWPVASLEGVTGLAIDPAIFASNPGTFLVVRRTTFFWRVYTAAFGILETEWVDLMVLKSAFNRVIPLHNEATELKEDILSWMKDLCSAGTYENTDEVDELRKLLTDAVRCVPMNQLKKMVEDLNARAQVSPGVDEGQSPSFPALYAPDPDGELGIEGGHLLKLGRDLVAKLEGRS